MSDALTALMAKHAVTTQGAWSRIGPYMEGGYLDGGYLLTVAIEGRQPEPEVGIYDTSEGLHGWKDGLSDGDSAFCAAAHNTLPQVAQDFAALRAERDNYQEAVRNLTHACADLVMDRDAAVKRAEACEALANHYRKSLDRVAYEMDNVPDDLREELREECRLEDAAIAAGCQLELDGDA